MAQVALLSISPDVTGHLGRTCLCVDIYDDVVTSVRHVDTDTRSRVLVNASDELQRQGAMQSHIQRQVGMC